MAKNKNFVFLKEEKVYSGSPRYCYLISLESPSVAVEGPYRRSLYSHRHYIHGFQITLSWLHGPNIQQKQKKKKKKDVLEGSNNLFLRNKVIVSPLVGWSGDFVKSYIYRSSRVPVYLPTNLTNCGKRQIETKHKW